MLPNSSHQLPFDYSQAHFIVDHIAQAAHHFFCMEGGLLFLENSIDSLFQIFVVGHDISLKTNKLENIGHSYRPN
ncbi:MAG: hypothetical protein ACJA0X_002486 [Cyclobacteriaceae bacterium]